ncbi:Uma2 family endonuclease [Roseospira goensis]|uniref:Uma2 family endonuclease n=1 Tax=Roseospira goensis TaxID=391922 RepID=A0A7W6S1W8_9PROT|nr:Uma2 family endonuclease [Roseospira goensis]MBB4287391.1 Uma2 family endonuclease [Roseospira goensis]
MAEPATPDGTPMDRAAFHAWCRSHGGRYERLAGRLVAMAPERRAHVRAKQALWLALRTALAAQGSPCEALVDGLTVEAGADTDFVPDVLIDCGPAAPGDIAAARPVVVAEVLSPGSRGVDTGYKLAGYAGVDSIAHYLIVDPDRPRLIHHARAEGGTWRTALVTGGRLWLDPPGVSLDVDALYA